MKNILRDKFLIALLLLTILIGFGVWISEKAEQNIPSANGGIFDLDGWDFEESGILALDGEWEFYPNQLLTPDSIDGQRSKAYFIQVPGKWNGMQYDEGQQMQGKGYGTYRLLVKHAPAEGLLAISKNYVRFADRLYVNGQLLGESGQPGQSKESYQPRNVPYTVYFQNTSDEVEILLQVANFDFRIGGITNSLQLGLGKQMEVRKSFQVGLELMGAVILLIFGFLHSGLYLWFHRNPLLILFGAFLFLFAVSVVMNGERIVLQLMPELSFELLFKIKNFVIYMMPALLFFISWRLLGQAGIRRLLLISSGVLAAYCIGIVVLPFRIYSYVQDAVYIGLTMVGILLLCFLFHSYVKERYGSLGRRQFQLYMAAVWSVLLTGVIVAWNSRNIISMMLANLTFMLFVLFLSMMLLHQYISAYSAMQRLAAKLQKADVMKDEFLLITSHELNTPLHGIINLSQTLLKEPLKKSAESEIRERLQLIRNTAYRMSNMVKDIIDAAKIKEGRLDVETGRVDLVTCVSVVIEVFGFLAKGKNTVLTHQIDPAARYVFADENRLMQVLYNAINHSLVQVQDGIVVIASRQKEGAEVVIEISRTGMKDHMIGGSQDADEEKEGYGFAVGLSTAYELTQLMGGKFVQDNDRGKVEITLPAAEAAGINESAATSELPSGQQLHTDLGGSRTAKEGAAKILIASADPVNVEHLYSMLVTEGFEVICASTDKDAYSLIARINRPDIALIDVMLPDTNGYELCRRIRQHFTLAEMPVLFIAARSTPADIEAGIAAGGSDFIARPLDAGEIRVRINTLLSMKRLVKESALNEMAFLRSQIKPHFLYNTLGTIMSLCYTDGARAGELLGVFSRYLRNIFHLDNTEETVTLSKEMEMIQAYIDIEQERFGDRVQVEFNVDEALYSCQVMPLTIEPLVENAIRHGVLKKVSGGMVRLTIRRQEEFIQVVVEDNGAGMMPGQVESILQPGKQGEGVGFRNIMRRVAHLTGKPPVVESELGRGTKVTIWLPLIYTSMKNLNDMNG
ncbi:response regulator [Paenibacillaceae bacterium]|nr:response regulator [Paenibacillaceae bacterium]